MKYLSINHNLEKSNIRSGVRWWRGQVTGDSEGKKKRDKREAEKTTSQIDLYLIPWFHFFLPHISSFFCRHADCRFSSKWSGAGHILGGQYQINDPEINQITKTRPFHPFPFQLSVWFFCHWYSSNIYGLDGQVESGAKEGSRISLKNECQWKNTSRTKT